MRDETPAKNRVDVSVLVTSVNPVTQELIAQLGFRLAGDIAQDEVTPAANVQVSLRSLRHQHVALDDDP
jgi:hypothetical protein